MRGHDRKPYGPAWTWRSWLLLPVWVAAMTAIVLIPIVVLNWFLNLWGW